MALVLTMSLAAMELLLILSAMLSAVAGVREAEAPVQRTEAAAEATLAVAVAQARSTVAAPALPVAEALSREVPPLPGFAVAAPPPLETIRLNE